MVVDWLRKVHARFSRADDHVGVLVQRVLC